DRVREHHDEFWHCSFCDRIYWPGSHVRRMKRRLDEIFEGG
ncbi:MAG: twitching motility protein PilT, partial [Gammaproteobacteria bacterium]|nr:twitching motility protein PilT [Gemmatimonadota bacterium]NIU77243.1 twitching motility protein PilT [Gammaproteobacteria bacterium]